MDCEHDAPLFDPDTGLEGFLEDHRDHLMHIWPVEPFAHSPEADCICDPEFLTDEYGFYFLHGRVSPEGD